MKFNFYHIFNTFFYTGYLKGGGSFASAIFAAVILFTPVKDAALLLVFSLTLLLAVISLEFSTDFKGDDSRIVIDEVLGMAIALMFLPKTFFTYISAFIMFRFFDIAKPLFIKYSEKVNGGTGIILDDIVSGTISNLIVAGIIFALRITVAL